MADRFLDFRSPTTNYNIPLILPSNHYYSSSLYSHNLRISRIRKAPHHLTLLSASPSSELDVISTHEHSDGSVLFRFGDPNEVAKHVKTGEESKTVKEEIEGEGKDESRVVKDSVLEKREVDDVTISLLSSSSTIAVVEEESESSEKLLESTSDAELPVLTSGGETQDVSTPNLDTEHIEDAEEGLNEEYEGSSPVESSILDAGSVVESDNAEVENNTITPEFLEKDNTQETSVKESSVLDEGSIVESDNAKVDNNTTTQELLDKENAQEPSVTEPIIGVPDNGILQASLGTAEHKNVETEMQIETNEDSRESSDSNLVSSSPQSEPAIILSKEIEEQNLQAEIQKVACSKSDMNNIEALEMQSVMSNGNASDACSAEAKFPTMEDEASGAESGMLCKAVECLSEKNMIQLMTMPPRLETDSVLEEETGIGTVEEPREDNGSENQKVGGDLVEASVHEATVTESTPISKSNMNDIEDLEMQIVMGSGNESDTSDAEAMSPTMGDNASGAGSVKDTIQLMTMPPQFEASSVLEVETGVLSVEESREDDGSKNLKEGGDLTEASVHEAAVTEPTPMSQEMLKTNFVLSSGAALLLHPSKVLTGGEDAYFVSGQTWLGVADGVSMWSLEGTNPGVYAQELIKNCEKLISVNNGDSISNPVELLNLSVADTDSPGSSTVLITQFDGQALHVANVGDSGFIVLRNGSIHKRSSPMNHAFHFPMRIERGDDPSSLAEFYRVDLEEDDIIITATDGLLDNLYDEEISLIVMKSLAADRKMQEIAEKLALKAQEIGRSECVRTPFGDDARAAGFAGCTGGKLDDIAVIVSVVQRR
ncbi:hypothetical protein ACS0TY_011681 [Phlomoides rotata]